jgi:hypothetical protein
MCSDPLSPELAVPVLSTNNPLTPAVPAFAVVIDNLPLLDTELKPVLIEKRPPEDEEDVPPDSTTAPPAPLLPDPAVRYTEPLRPPDAEPEYM